MSKGLKAQKTTSERDSSEQNGSPAAAEEGKAHNGVATSSASDTDLFSFLSAMHLNGSGLISSPSTQQSRKRKFLEQSTGKSSWLRGNSQEHCQVLNTCQQLDEGVLRLSRKSYPPAQQSLLSEIDDENLAANFDDSLSGLGVDIHTVTTSSYGMSEALLALPNLSISSSQQHPDESEFFKETYNEGETPAGETKTPEETDGDLLTFGNIGGSHPNLSLISSIPKTPSDSVSSPRRSSNPTTLEKKESNSKEVEKLNSQADEDQRSDNKFEYMLMAASSIATKINEPSITYLNQGNPYELRLRKLGDLSGFRKRTLTCKIRICFHERRLQYSEQEQIAEWSSTHLGERILDLDIANSYGILDHIRDPRQLNVISFKWDPTRETAISIKVNCVSTEFTPKKHGGEKGVPFRLQVETYDSEESGGARLHAAGCILQIFKLKGADRKHKQDREKIGKKSPSEQELYAKPCKTTVLTDLPIDNIYVPQNSFSRSVTPVSENASELRNANTKPVQQPSSSKGEESSVKEEYILGNSFPNNNATNNSTSPDIIPSGTSTSPPKEDALSPLASSEEVVTWLSRHRFGQHLTTFRNYNGRDLLRLTREEVVSLIGASDGLRFYNSIHTVTIPPRSTFYVAQKDSNEFHALFLEEYSVDEFIKRFSGIIGVFPALFSAMYLIGPLGILVRVTDTVVRYMRPETIFHFSLRHSTDQNGACDIILEEVSALLQQQSFNEEEQHQAGVLEPSSQI